MGLNLVSREREKRNDCIKKPATCYMLYCKAVRPILKNQFPNHLNSEITKLLAIMWKKLSKAEQDSWRYLAQEGKKFFEEAYPDFVFPSKKRRRYMTRNRMELEKLELDKKQTDFLRYNTKIESSFDYLLFNYGKEE